MCDVCVEGIVEGFKLNLGSAQISLRDHTHTFTARKQLAVRSLRRPEHLEQIEQRGSCKLWFSKILTHGAGGQGPAH